MGDVKSIVPEWTYDDFTSVGSAKPYEWLYEKREDKFLFLQYRNAIRDAARAVGVKDFVGRYKAYEQSQAAKRGERFDNVTMFDGQPCELLCGDYTCDDLGIFTTNKFGDEVQVCDHPIMPVKRLVNVDSHEVKIEIAFKRRSRWVHMIFDKATLSSNQKILELSKYGIGVDSENSRDLVRYLSAMENLNYNDLEETKSVGRLGWIDGFGFSPYDGNLMFDGELCFKSVFDAIQQRGNFDKWKDICISVRKRGVIARISLAASFASAFIQPFNLRPFFVHLWGGAGNGKTVSLMLAASVWANPVIGEYIHTFNSTGVGQEMMAGFLNSMPLCIDELQVIKDKRDFDNIIYTLSEGTGRSRGSKYGGIQKMQTWRNCIITTGEMPITGNASGGGAVDRVLGIDCKDEMIFDDVRTVLDTIDKNYGFGGRWLVEWMGEEANLASIKPFFDAQFTDFLKTCATERQALAGALIMTADFVIGSCLFKDDAFLTREDIAQYLTTKEARDVNLRSLDWIVDMVAANPARFRPNASTGDYIGECWGCVDDGHAYIIKSVFDAKMTDAGFNPTAFLSWAKRTGNIETDCGRTTKVKRIPGLGSTARCVCINSPMLLEEIDIIGNIDNNR